MEGRSKAALLKEDCEFFLCKSIIDDRLVVHLDETVDQLLLGLCGMRVDSTRAQDLLDAIFGLFIVVVDDLVRLDH